MALTRRFGNDPNLYSTWHRPERLCRLVGEETAKAIGLIDIDAVELSGGHWDPDSNAWIEGVPKEYTKDHSMDPVALIETAEDVGQRFKPCSVVRKLGDAARIAMPHLSYWCTLYKPNSEGTDIESFRVSDLRFGTGMRWREMSPEQYCAFLVELRAEWKKRNPESYLRGVGEWKKGRT